MIRQSLLTPDAESKNLFSALMSLVPDLIVIADRSGTCLEIRAELEKDHSPSELLGTSLTTIITLDNGSLDQVIEQTFRAGPKLFECSVQNEFFTGRFIGRMTKISDAEVMILLRDVSEQTAMKATIEHYTLHDALTGLPNRQFLERRYEQSRNNMSRFESAILYLDLKRFKSVNDSFGHQQGDQLLIQVAERIRDAVRSRDVVARISGDEFAFFLTEADEKTAVRVANRIMKTIKVPFKLDAGRFELGASLGMVIFDRFDNDFDEVSRRALLAMHRAKNSGGGIKFYDPEADNRLRQKTWLEHALKDALRQEKLELYYQPIMQLRQGQLMAAEALLRWKHYKKGLISPGEFIPIAEETGLITEIDRWVVQRATQQAKAAGFSVAVNMSPLSLKDSDLVSHISNCLKMSGLKPGDLIIEITEQVLARPEETLQTVQGLHDLGVQIAVDDFGTGYSSLSYLTNYPLDILKVDRGFVSRVNEDIKARAIARSIIRLGQSLNLVTLAEGVETEAQLSWLKEEGCELAQGFFLERPMPFAEIRKLISDNS